MHSNKRIVLGFAAVLAILTLTALTSARAAVQTETVLFSFDSTGTSGSAPNASVIFDSVGNLYGTATLGGGSGCSGSGCGVVFELMPQAGGGWIERVLHNFNDNATDGEEPAAALIFDSAGNLYGTTQFGGAHGYGTVFELTPHAKGNWTEKILHSFNFNGTDGYEPAASAIFDASGNLYGVTQVGGLYGWGIAFELSPQAGGAWKEKVLHNFGNGNDGWLPHGLIFDALGNLYGTASSGDLHDAFGGGSIFELSPQPGGGWKEIRLAGIPTDSGNAPAHPNAGLIFDHSGNLYSTSYSGGADGTGTVFELSPKPGAGWSMKTLHSFSDTIGDGGHPGGGVIFDAAGNLYGTTSDGGTSNESEGIVYKLGPEAGGGWTETILYDFDNLESANGLAPNAGVILDSAGNLYGTTTYGGTHGVGTVFEITQ
jgi:uncharacterized repeat protein (TIGR03803 family)